MASKRKKAVAAVKAVATRTASTARRAAGGAVVVVQRAMRSPRARAAASAAVRGGSAMAIAQARIVPAVVGGYAVAVVERAQRKAHARAVESAEPKVGPDGKIVPAKPVGGAVIADPTMRLAGMAVVLAFAASKTTGIAKEAICGAAGGLGALAEIYRSTDGANPADSFVTEIKAGRPGI